MMTMMSYSTAKNPKTFSKQNIVIVSGGFDPIHSGHISMFKQAKNLRNQQNKVIALVNSDAWLERKKVIPFLPMKERLIILNSIRYIDKVVELGEFDDFDDTVTKPILEIISKYPYNKIIFANGGDRKKGRVPEEKIKEIEFVYGIGGQDKRNSSSTILHKYFEERLKWYCRGSFLRRLKLLFLKGRL